MSKQEPQASAAFPTQMSIRRAGYSTGERGNDFEIGYFGVAEGGLRAKRRFPHNNLLYAVLFDPTKSNDPQNPS